MWSDLVCVGGAVQVITDAVFAPSQAWYVRAATHGNDWAACANTGLGCSVVDNSGRRWDAPPGILGENPCGIQAIDGGWRVVYMDPPTGQTCHEAILNLSLALVSLTQIPGRPQGTSQGFLNFQANGLPLFLDDFRTYTSGPLTLFLPVIIGPWVIGQDGHAYQIAGVQTATGEKVAIAPSHAQTASFGTLDAAGELAVVLAGTTTVIAESQFTPWHQAEAPPVVPTFAPVDHTMALAFIDQPGGYDLTGVQENGQPWPVTEKTVGVFLTLGVDTGAKQEICIGLARQHHLPLIEYHDGRGYPVDQMVAPVGVTAWPQVQAYPLAGESVADFTQAIANELAIVTSRYRDQVWVYGCLYLGGVRTEQQALDCAQAVWDLCRAYRVRAVTWFAWSRGDTDGIVHIPSFSEAARRMVAACPTHDQWPHATTPPTPDPPKPEPPVRPFPMELSIMVTIRPSDLVLNTAADVADPVYIGPNYYHVKAAGGGYLSYDIAAEKFRDTGMPKVGWNENIQWIKGQDRAMLNMGLPQNLRTIFISELPPSA